MGLPRLGIAGTAAAVAAMLCCFAVLSFTAELGKSATYDEPLHFMGGLTIRSAHDFRINPEDPALFGWWASLPLSRSDLKLDTTDAFFEGTPNDLDQRWFFTVETLYRHGAAQADALLDRSRTMFIILGIALGAVIACWAYQIGGGWAAVSASVLYCCDPNFLAHAALIKNDVPFSLMMCLLGFLLWRFGRYGRWTSLAFAAIVCAIAFNIKLSAVLLLPMFFLLLTSRALLRAPWIVNAKLLSNWRQRFLIVVIGVAVVCVSIFIFTWTVYGFRYSATANGQAMPTDRLIKKSVTDKLWIERKKGKLGNISDEEFTADVAERVNNADFALPVKFVLWMQTHHVLPESWLYGFLFTYSYSLLRSSYLLGSVGVTGWWYYFPLTILFKTATATLVAMAIVPALWMTARWLRRHGELDGEFDDEGEPAPPPSRDWWTVLVLIIPPAIYFSTIVSANLNLGVRHVLPIFPYLYVAMGVGIASIFARWPKAAGTVAVVLALALVTETASAYPNYLAFFNVLSGGSLGGLKLLGDSNLDWGQDLPALAQWQKEHPTDKLYLDYFGTADPTAYGIDFVNLPGGWPFAPPAGLDASEPGVVAMSATNVQGIYNSPQLTQAYHSALQDEKPFRVLNGSIYLYNWPPKK